MVAIRLVQRFWRRGGVWTPGCQLFELNFLVLAITIFPALISSTSPLLSWAADAILLFCFFCRLPPPEAAPRPPSRLPACSRVLRHKTWFRSPHTQKVHHFMYIFVPSLTSICAHLDVELKLYYHTELVRMGSLDDLTIICFSHYVLRGRNGPLLLQCCLSHWGAPLPKPLV